MKELFFWLICNTSIDKSNQIINNDIKKYFLEVYPDCNTSNLNGLIGMFLYSIYGNNLIKRTVSNSILYNLRVHSKPVKEIIIHDLE